MICNKCKKDKSLDMFSKRKDSKKGYRTICKDCNCFKKYNRGYLGKNGEFLKKSFEYDNNTKFCTYCNEIKDILEFEVKCKIKNKRRSWCFSCDSIKKKLKEYNITKEFYLSLVIEQKGLCKICNKPNSNGRELYVDHDHETNKVRALLCSNCNTAIGKFKEDISILESAINYLKYHQSYK